MPILKGFVAVIASIALFSPMKAHIGERRGYDARRMKLAEFEKAEGGLVFFKKLVNDRPGS